MERMPKSGELYRHFKDKMYQILTVASHSETGEQLVIYQALYGDYKTYARPLEMFVSEVDHIKYPNVKQKYRFERVERETLNTCDVKEKTIEATDMEQADNESQEEILLDENLINPRLISFLDTDNWDEKYNILVSLRDTITDKLVDDFAVALDVVIPEGPIDKRYEQLKNCVRTRQKFESQHLR